ncbi:MAG: hypothetical protein ABR879_02835, partial [Methanomassiliicoccales archaeon]
MSLEDLRKFSPLVGPDVYRAISLESGLMRRKSFGGTSPSAVKEQLGLLKERYGAVQRSVRSEKDRIAKAYSKLINQ